MSSTEPTGPQPTSEGLRRREVMRRTGAVGAGLLLGGAGASTQFSTSARAFSPAGGLISAGMGVTNYVSDFLADDNTDEAEELEGAELHARIYADALEEEPQIEDHSETGLNSKELLKEYVRTNVSFVIAEEAQSGSSEAETLDAAEEEVAETVAQFQRRNANRFERNTLKLARRINLVDEDEGNIGLDDVFEPLNYQDSSTDLGNGSLTDLVAFLHDNSYEELDLVDGSSVPVPDRTDGDWVCSITLDIDGLEEDTMVSKVAVTEPEGSSRAILGSAYDYNLVHDELEDMYNDELAEVQTLVDTLYQPIVDGEIDAHDIASGRAIRDAAEDPDHYGEAAGFYRAVGMPEGHAPVVIEVPGAQLEGTMFWTLPPEDGGLPVGTEIIPSGELGDLYIAADVREVDDAYGAGLGDTFEVDFAITTESGDPLGGADVEILDIVETTDSDGLVTLEDVPQGTRTVEIHHGEETTIKEIDVGDESGQSVSFDLIHTHNDETPDDEESAGDLEEGDVLAMRLTSAFEIVGIDGGGDVLGFDDRELIEPDQDDQDDIIDRMRDAYDNEQQTRQERQEVVLESDFDVSLPGFPEVGDFGESAVMGLAVIAGAVLLVVGIVSNVLDNLLP